MPKDEKFEERDDKPEWAPKMEFFTQMSADGRYVICKTVITAIKPVRYFEKVLEGGSRGKPEAKDQSENPEIESERR